MKGPTSPWVTCSIAALPPSEKVFLRSEPPEMQFCAYCPLFYHLPLFRREGVHCPLGSFLRNGTSYGFYLGSRELLTAFLTLFPFVVGIANLSCL